MCLLTLIEFSAIVTVLASSNLYRVSYVGKKSLAPSNIYRIEHTAVVPGNNLTFCLTGYEYCNRSECIC